jgi:hypothetical protein
MSTDGAGHGSHGGLGQDIGHSAGLANADLDLGHSQHGHHGGGHHGGINHNGKVTVEALMVAYSHSAAPSFSNFGHVNANVSSQGMADHGSLGGWSTGDGIDHDKSFLKSNEAFLKAVEEAKNDPLRRIYGAHVVSHGYLDLPRIFTELGTKLGAIRVCGTTGNFNPTDVSLNDITDWSKFTPPYSRRRPPAGWYAKAPGVTHIWRQYWQVAPESFFGGLWNRPKGRPIYDRSQSTYLEVNIVTWYFAAIGDYETRVDIKVVSLPVLDQADKRWAVRGTPLKRHQCVAEGLIDGLVGAMIFAEPTDWAKERRSKLIKLQTTRPAEVEQSGADLDSLFATYSDETTFAVPAVAKRKAAPTAVKPPAEKPAAQAVAPASKAPTPTGKEVTVHVEIPARVLR